MAGSGRTPTVSRARCGCQSPKVAENRDFAGDRYHCPRRCRNRGTVRLPAGRTWATYRRAVAGRPRRFGPRKSKPQRSRPDPRGPASALADGRAPLGRARHLPSSIGQAAKPTPTRSGVFLHPDTGSSQPCCPAFGKIAHRSSPSVCLERPRPSRVSFDCRPPTPDPLSPAIRPLSVAAWLRVRSGQANCRVSPGGDPHRGSWPRQESSETDGLDRPPHRGTRCPTGQGVPCS